MTRPDKIFGHKLLLTPIASYVGLAALIGGWFFMTPGWLVVMLICTFMLLMGVTVGMHRLFCHASFQTSPFWHGVLAYLGTLAVYGSTVQWAGMHASHHKYSDTSKDPHYTGWRYLFWKKNRETIFNRRVMARLYRQSMHRFFHQYYTLVLLGTGLGLYLIDPLALLFCYLMPLGWLHLVGSLHQVFAHGTSGPKNQSWFELVFFTGGEWIHKNHHDHQRSPKFGLLDAGYYFISLIRTDGRSPKQGLQDSKDSLQVVK